MKFLKDAFSFLIFDVVLFIVYYVLGSFVQTLEIEGAEIITDIAFSVLTWVGFFLLYALKTADRKGPGLYYLLENEKTPLSPMRAFDPLSEMKRGNFDLLIYAVFCLIPGWDYYNTGITLGQNGILSEIFLPQTLLFKISGSAIWGYILSVAVFYIISSTILAAARKSWLKAPLSPEERIKVDPEWTPEE